MFFLYIGILRVRLGLVRKMHLEREILTNRQWVTRVGVRLRDQQRTGEGLLCFLGGKEL